MKTKRTKTGLQIAQKQLIKPVKIKTHIKLEDFLDHFSGKEILDAMGEAKREDAIKKWVGKGELTANLSAVLVHVGPTELHDALTDTQKLALVRYRLEDSSITEDDMSEARSLKDSIAELDRVTSGLDLTFDMPEDVLRVLRDIIYKGTGVIR